METLVQAASEDLLGQTDSQQIVPSDAQPPGTEQSGNPETRNLQPATATAPASDASRSTLHAQSPPDDVQARHSIDPPIQQSTNPPIPLGKQDQHVCGSEQSEFSNHQPGDACLRSNINYPSSEASAKEDQPGFARCAGETPRAFAAFMTYFNLGQARSLQTVADKTGEGLSTVKQWSAKFSWVERLHSFQTGLLTQQASDETERQRKHAADWAGRLERFREQEWDAAQKLLSAAQCFLESFGDEQLGKMTLSQVSRALRISSDIGRSALAGAELPVSSEPAMSPIQQQMLQALARAYAKSAPQDSAAIDLKNPPHKTPESSPSPPREERAGERRPFDTEFADASAVIPAPGSKSPLPTDSVCQ